jgi:hypothetical protein
MNKGCTFYKSMLKHVILGVNYLSGEHCVTTLTDACYTIWTFKIIPFFCGNPMFMWQAEWWKVNVYTIKVLIILIFINIVLHKVIVSPFLGISCNISGKFWNYVQNWYSLCRQTYFSLSLFWTTAWNFHNCTCIWCGQLVNMHLPIIGKVI